MNLLLVAVLILLTALLLGMGLMSYALYALLGLLLLSRFLSRSWAEDLEVERSCSQLQAEIGEQVVVTLRVTHRGHWPIPWVLLEDLLPRRALMFSPPHLALEGERIRLVTMAPGSEHLVRYELTCNRRGYYQLGPLVMETGDLFGLHRKFRILSEPQYLVVYPKVLPLRGYEISSRRPIGEVRMSYRLYEDPTRNAGVREYYPGDPLNRVHWGATARTGVLHSKVYEPSTVAGATLLVDFHRRSYPEQDEPVRSELAVTAAASIANALYELGQQVGLVTNGRDAADRIRHEGYSLEHHHRELARERASMMAASDRLAPQVVGTRRGADQLNRIVELLARVELTDGLRLPELIGETSARMPRDAAVIAIVSHLEERDAIALGNLRRQGFAVSVILNLHDNWRFADAAGPLLAQRLPVHHLRSEEDIVSVCLQTVVS